MDLFDAIYGLRATRVYDDRAVPDPTCWPRSSRPRPGRAARATPSRGSSCVVIDRERKVQLKQMLADAFATIDAQRAQSAEQLIDGAGRPVTGHAAIENIDVVGAIVFVFWNPDRGIRMKGEYEENADGTLRQTRPIPGGRGSSLFPACQNMMLAAHALGVLVAVHDVLRARRATRSRSCCTCRRACSSSRPSSSATAPSRSASLAASR